MLKGQKLLIQLMRYDFISNENFRVKFDVIALASAVFIFHQPFYNKWSKQFGGILERRKKSDSLYSSHVNM